MQMSQTYFPTRIFNRMLSDKNWYLSKLLYGGYQILVQKVFERDLSRDGKCKKLKF